MDQWKGFKQNSSISLLLRVLIKDSTWFLHPQNAETKKHGHHQTLKLTTLSSADIRSKEFRSTDGKSENNQATQNSYFMTYIKLPTEINVKNSRFITYNYRGRERKLQRKSVFLRPLASTRTTSSVPRGMFGLEFGRNSIHRKSLRQKKGKRWCEWFNQSSARLVQFCKKLMRQLDDEFLTCYIK